MVRLALQARGSSRFITDQPYSVPPDDSPGTSREILRFDDLHIDVPERQVLFRGKELAVTPIEFRLLVNLLRAPGHLFEYCRLAEDVLGYSCSERDARASLQVHVSNLRRKLDDDPQRPRYIHCVRGAGYRLGERPAIL